MILSQTTHRPGDVRECLFLAHLGFGGVNASCVYTFRYLSFWSTFGNTTIRLRHLIIFVRWLIILLNYLLSSLLPFFALSRHTICIDTTDDTCIFLINLSDSASPHPVSRNSLVCMIVVAWGVIHGTIEGGITPGVCINSFLLWLSVHFFRLVPLNFAHET